MTDGEQGFLSPGWARPELVTAVSACVAEWERTLAAPVLQRDNALQSLVQRSQRFEAPARSVGFGGLAHHLAELSRLAQTTPPVTVVREQLAVVRDLLASARASLTPQELAKVLASEAGPASSLLPPPLLSGHISALQGGAAAPPQPPPAPAAGLAPPRMLTSMGARVAAPGVSAPPLVSLDSAPPGAAQRPLPGVAPPAAAPPLATVKPEPLGAVPVPVAPLASRPGQPNLMVRSVLSLRAFGRKESSPPAGAGAPGVPGQSSESSVLGLQRRSAPSVPPQALGGGYGGLSALGGSLGAGNRSGSGGAPSLELPLPRGGLSAAENRRGAQRTPPPMSATRPRPKAGGRLRQREGQGESRWWIGLLAALGVCAVVLGIVVVAVMLTRRGDGQVATTGTGTGNASASASAAADGAAFPGSGASGLPRSRLLNDDERFKSLLSQVHGRGGKESAELRALLDEQAALAAQALQPGCVGPQCAALAELGKVVTATGKRRVKRRSHSPDTMRSRWLAGLEMPEIPVEDDPRVQKRFEFYTENPLGRETFQAMLFRCGQYRDTIQSTLIRRGLPKDLIAVAYAESGCYPLAKSPMGAEGLWQFIPDAARAYHLRIIPDVVDERHSPQKSTDAAIQYFSDMYAKFGSWDLVFSAYNMGPWGLAARLERVEGENVGFWELVDAEMIPGETADYAPAIQAIALILNNLQRLKFGGIQQGAPQMTMDLPVPPQTRMTLIARAAATSMDSLRRLNLDIKGTSTPNVQNFSVQVPKDSVWQARDTLQELLKSKDESDLCAPQNFDWGRQRFTTEMQEACARNLGNRTAPVPSARPLAPAPAPAPTGR